MFVIVLFQDMFALFRGLSIMPCRQQLPPIDGLHCLEVNKPNYTLDIYVCIYTYMYIYVYIRKYENVFAHLHIYIYIHIHIPPIYMYIYVYMYTYEIQIRQQSEIQLRGFMPSQETPGEGGATGHDPRNHGDDDARGPGAGTAGPRAWQPQGESKGPCRPFLLKGVMCMIHVSKCMYVCMHACMHACMHVCMYVGS